jgi:hypothetical protein
VSHEDICKANIRLPPLLVAKKLCELRNKKTHSEILYIA